MRIVIAEDSVLLREGIVRLLTDSGHQVVAAVSNGPDLIAAIERERPDISIVDVRMPPGFQDEGLRAAIEAGDTSAVRTAVEEHLNQVEALMVAQMT